MAELDTDLVDFFRIRTVERRIERGPGAQEEAEAEYARWWWTNKKTLPRCGSSTVWPTGDTIVCDLYVDHDGVCLGPGRDGHLQAFTVR